MDDAQIIAKTCRWLEKAVIGLNLCPFAAAPYSAGRVHFVVSHERSAAGLSRDFERAMRDLSAASPRQRETTLLIHPWVLNDFPTYNAFLDVCDALLAQLGLAGELQVASFHPDYQFAGTAPQDIENFTNRSPFPTLHLLREESVSRAVDSTNTEEIYLNNIEVLRALGHAGWHDLWRDQS